MRLDQDLEKFFSFLDATVGKGQYTVFLTADHGAAQAVGYMQKHLLPADFWKSQPVLQNLDRLIGVNMGMAGLVKSGVNYQVNYDMRLISSEHLNIDSIKRISVDYLKTQKGIAFAVDVARIAESTVPEPIRTMIINGYNFKRSGPVQMVLEPGWFEGYGNTGTTHGSWNPYDTHIPLIFMGWGVKQGSSNSVVNMTDIAPTVAALLHIQAPNGCVGKPLTEVLSK